MTTRTERIMGWLVASIILCCLAMNYAYATNWAGGTYTVDTLASCPSVTTDSRCLAMDTKRWYVRSGGTWTAVHIDFAFVDNFTSSGTGTVLTLYVEGKEENVAPIQKGQVVSIHGSSGTKIDFALSDNTSTIHDRIIGVAYSDIAQNANGTVVMQGIITGVDTRATNTYVNPNGETWTSGDLLWMTTNGGMTNIRPTSGRNAKVARTVKGSSASDELIVLPFENPVWLTAAAGENVVTRLGDTLGVDKLSVRDYLNNEVAYINSLGSGSLSGTIVASNLSGTNTGDQDLSGYATMTSLNTHTTLTAAAHGGIVPSTRTVNGYALSSDISLPFSAITGSWADPQGPQNLASNATPSWVGIYASQTSTMGQTKMQRLTLGTNTMPTLDGVMNATTYQSVGATAMNSSGTDLRLGGGFSTISTRPAGTPVFMVSASGVTTTGVVQYSKQNHAAAHTTTSAITVTSRIVEVTTDGDGDEDYLYLPAGIDSQKLGVCVKSNGASTDSFTLTTAPALMTHGTMTYNFGPSAAGKCIELVYSVTATAGWAIVGGVVGTETTTFSAATESFSSTTAAASTYHKAAVAANKSYSVICDILSTSTSATNGIRFAMAAPATTSWTHLSTRVMSAATTTTNAVQVQWASTCTGCDTILGTAMTSQAMHNYRGIARTTAAGTLNLYIGASMAGNAIGVNVGSVCRWRQLN